MFQKSASELELDIFEKKLVLESSKYFLEVSFSSKLKRILFYLSLDED